MLLERRLPMRYLFNMIKNDVFRVMLFSIFFHVLKLFIDDHLPDLPVQLPTVLGTSISLILAFKINHSYDRWWEARKVWGAIVNDSRTLILELKGFIKEDALGAGETTEVLRKMANRQICWCYTLGDSLRNLDPAANIRKYLSDHDATIVARQQNKSFALLGLHMQELRTLQQQNALNPYQQVQLDNTLLRLTESMGKAERIKNTVFPVTYRLFVHFFIYLFLVILSLTLVESIGRLEIPLLIIIASTFFLLEKTATYLQDPFVNMPTDTPVTAIARTIEINILQLLEEPEVPEPLQSDAFYLM